MTSRLAPLALVATLGACGHSDAFTGGRPPEQDGPLTLSAPTRLTYDEGMEHVASVSTDGATLFYSFRPRLPAAPAVPARPDVDRCIGLLPIGGGTRREICRLDFISFDSTDAFEQAAVGPDGSLLYGAYSSRIGAPLVGNGALRLATLATPWPGRVLLTTPNVVGGFSFDHFGTVRWASPTTFFVAVHDQTLIGSPLNDAKVDSLALGIGILRGDLSASGAVFTAVAGTDSASGFDLSAARDSLYFTRLDDASLYVVAAGGGTRRVVYSAAGAVPRKILRDPTRIGTRFAVVRQDYQDRDRVGAADPQYGLAPGSTIELVRPADGTAMPLASAIGSRMTQGALAAFGGLVATPDGCRLIVEHRLVQQFTFTTDLYSYCLGTAGQCTCG